MSAQLAQRSAVVPEEAGGTGQQKCDVVHGRGRHGALAAAATRGGGHAN